MSSGALRSVGAADFVRAAPFEPIVFNRPQKRIDGPLRITLLNAQGGRHFEGIVACLSRPPLNRSSVILFCESDWGTVRAGLRETAAEWAQRLEMSFAYGPTFGIPVGDGTFKSFLGNAILSASPIENVRAVAIPLPHPEYIGRLLRTRVGISSGLVANARFGRRDLTIGVVHLASHCNPIRRAEQMATYLAGFPAQGPAILGGDLNTTTTELMGGRALLGTMARMLINPWRFRAPQRREPLFAHLAAAGMQIEGVNAMGKPTFTFSRVVPPIFRPKLDWLAIRGLKSVAGSAKVVPARPSFFDRRVSDHDFITVELTL